MSRIWYSLFRVLQLQQQKHDLDLQQPVPGSRQRPRSWSTILLGSGMFAAVFGVIVGMLRSTIAGEVLILAGAAAFVAGLVLMVAEIVLDMRN